MYLKQNQIKIFIMGGGKKGEILKCLSAAYLRSCKFVIGRPINNNRY